MQPMYSYPRRWYWLLRGLPLLLVALVALQGALIAVRALVGLIERWRPLPLSDFWRLAGEPLPALLAALLALAAALGLALLAANLLPPVSVSQQGLYFHTLRRVRFVPWEEVRDFFATRAGSSSRSLLFIRTQRGAPWYSRLHGLLVGAGAKPGFLVTSDLAEFGPAMGYALRTLEAARGVEGVRWEERPAGAFLTMLAAPQQRIALLWPVDEQGNALSIAPDAEALQQAARLAVGVALAAPLLLLAGGLWGLEVRWSALVLFGLGLIEWPLCAYWLVAVGDLLARPPTWREMLVLYPETQLVRWPIALAALALVLVRAPRWLVALPLLAGLLWSGWLLSLLTQRLYGATTGRGWLGSVVPLIFQTVLYGVLLYLL